MFEAEVAEVVEILKAKLLNPEVSVTATGSAKRPSTTISVQGDLPRGKYTGKHAALSYELFHDDPLGPAHMKRFAEMAFTGVPSGTRHMTVDERTGEPIEVYLDQPLETSEP